MTINIESCDIRKRLMVLADDLRANDVFLAKLVEGYELFRFMGGVIPQAPLVFEAMNGDSIDLCIVNELRPTNRRPEMMGKTSPYRLNIDANINQYPMKDSREFLENIARYRFLAQTIWDLGQATSSKSNPRSLANRKVIADKFDQAYSEMSIIGLAIGSALPILLNETQSSNEISQSKHGENRPSQPRESSQLSEDVNKEYATPNFHRGDLRHTSRETRCAARHLRPDQGKSSECKKV